ncbi:hypothetical protein A3K69_07990 [Candidatus Bathyarchaeota archaeon RBG_16_57_9]|nr:MAG: hypothetical protein A3K69_07990 [Candidatus Bathyarchaeota archaeon RBG_16_57_9]OGD52137.1 MAG: hypothetical protein A3K81_05450 [Candidatus Bathyarchaeota archaeon RBG_13_60_20]
MKQILSGACPLLPGSFEDKSPLDSALVWITRFCRSWKNVLPIIAVASVILVYSMAFAQGSLAAAIAETGEIPSTWNQDYPTVVKALTRHRGDEHLYKNQVNISEDLVISGDQVYVIENCTAVLEGYIMVTDQAQLVIRDAELYNVKRGINGGELVPYPANVYLEDHASLVLENAVIRGEHRILVTLNNYTRAEIESSILEGDLIVFGDSNVELRNSTVSFIKVAQRANIGIHDSHVYYLFYEEEGPLVGDFTFRIEHADFTGVTIESWDSVFEVVRFPIRGCRDFSHTGGVSWGPDWSLRDLYPTAEVLDFSSHDSDIKRYVFILMNCTAIFSEVPELDGIYSYDTELIIDRCRLMDVAMLSGEGVIQDSIITMAFVDGDTKPTFINDKIWIIALRNYTETAEFENTYVETLFVEGSMTGSLKGSVTFGEEALNAYMLGEAVTRIYTLVTQTPKHVLPGARAQLFSPENELVWSGETDENGTATFQITYEPGDIDAKYLLVSTVEDNVCTSTVDLAFTEDPIIHEFEHLPERQNVITLAVQAASTIIILAVLILKKMSSI